MTARVGILERNSGGQPGAGNLAALIDVPRVNQVQGRVGGNQGVQVDHGAAFFPQERVGLGTLKADARCAHDLTL